MEQETAKLNITFVNDYLIYLKSIVAIQILVLIISISSIFLMIINEPKPIFFQLNSDDQLINNIGLEMPDLSEAELLNWVTEAMIVAFSFNYDNYDLITNKIEEFFDRGGVEKYLNMIKNHRHAKKLISHKLVMSGRPTAAPRI